MNQGPAEKTLVRQWGDSWQLWQTNADAAEWRRAESSGTPDELPAAADIFCLPARKVASLCFWVASAHEETVRESAALQVELHGLAAKDAAAGIVQIDLLRRQEERTLVRVVAFPPSYELPAPCEAREFFPSPLAIRFAEDGVFLWQEGLVLVLVPVVGGTPLCWETLPAAAPPAEVRGWIETFLLELRAAGVPDAGPRLHDFASILGGGAVAGLEVDVPAGADGLPPHVEGLAFAWLPAQVRAAREASRQRRDLVRVLSVAGVVLAAAVFAAASYVLYLRWDTARLHAQLRPAEAKAAPVIGAARKWELLSPSIQTENFVLEKLLLAVVALPPDGVRLAVFETTPEALRIEGEARNVGLATLYFNALQSSEQGGRYDWNMPPPALQPDNSARFSIDAVLRP